MQIKLYVNSSDERYSQKNIVLKHTATAQLTDVVTVESPSFLLDYNSNYLTCNYVHVPEFNRYYFINGREIRNGNQIVLHCTVDWRVSFRGNILQSDIIADRSASAGDAYVPDPMVTVRDSVTTIVRKVSSSPFVGPGGSNNYVLTIGGK